MTRIGVVGSINTDFVVRSERFPAPGETLIGESFAVYGGGKGANQAIAAARLGATVQFFGAAGRDPQSAERVQQLSTDGVGTGNIVTFDGYGGIAMIQVEGSSGQNAITLVPGANMLLTPDLVTPRLADWCQPGDLLCSQLEVPLETVQSSFAMKQRHGLTTILNAAPFDVRIAGFIALIDYLIVNEIEAGQRKKRLPQGSAYSRWVSAPPYSSPSVHTVPFWLMVPAEGRSLRRESTSSTRQVPAMRSLERSARA